MQSLVSSAYCYIDINLVCKLYDKEGCVFFFIGAKLQAGVAQSKIYKPSLQTVYIEKVSFCIVTYF